jgi:purine-binding chemotaxis protein CheW
MVDLVKIRKKAKKKAEDAAAAAAADQSSSRPVVQSSSDSPSDSAPVILSREDGEGSPAEAPQTSEPEGIPSTTGRLDDWTTGSSTTVRLDDSSTAPARTKLDKFKEQAGKRREAEIQHDAEEEQESDTGQLELLTFVVAQENYAVEIERIIEIVTPRSSTRIPNADNSILGIMSLRGTIVTLVDIRRKLRHPPAGAVDEETRIVVVEFRNEIVGFVVDRVLRVVKAAATEIEPHPVVHVHELDESVRGVFRVSGALTILLDLDKLLDSRALAAKTA